MKTYQFIAVVTAFLFTVLGCSKKDTIDLANTKAPEIKSILDVIQPDLNRADNIPLVCVVFAEAGLKSVKMKIVKNGVETDYKEVTTFYDNKQYSVKELPLWDDTFQSFKIIATDLGDRVTEKIIPISVIKYLAAPVITFPVAEIVIDENTGVITIPRTMFTVTGAAALAKVEVKLFSTSGTSTAISLDPAFVPGLMYEYNGEINYVAGNNALQVSATDVNGKIKIETLPIRYISIPAPELVVSGTTTLDPIVIASGVAKSLTFTATSSIGINAIRVYRMEKDVAVELSSVSKTYDKEKNIAFTAAIPGFTASTTGLRITAFDQLGRSTTVDIRVYVDLTYAPMVRAGSQFYSKVADAAYPGVYSFFSFKDMKTYPLSYFYTNRPNIDLIFYFFNGAVRLYPASNSRPTNEPFAGDAANGIPFINTWTGVPRNNLKMKKFVAGTNFTFDNVTATDLKSAAIQTYVNSAQVTADFADLVAGESVYFQTASSSTNGVKTGLMKIESITVDPTNNTKGFYVVSIKMAQ